jgi:DUF4097 and DUF4098 domain-containing protein YvlB
VKRLKPNNQSCPFYEIHLITRTKIKSIPVFEMSDGASIEWEQTFGNIKIKRHKRQYIVSDLSYPDLHLHANKTMLKILKENFGCDIDKLKDKSTRTIGNTLMRLVTSKERTI